MVKKSMSLDIILPSYKEGVNLTLLIPKIIEQCNMMGVDYTVHVIDTKDIIDNTRDVVSGFKNVNYVLRSPSNTYGDAIRTGIKLATKDHLLCMDADGSHPVEYIKILYDNRHKADVIIGSRYMPSARSENGFILKQMSLVLNLTYRLLFGLECNDISNSFKLYRVDELKKLILKSDNFNIIQEILIKLKRNNKHLNILEIPCPFYKRKYGTSKRNYFVFITTYIVSIIKLKLNL